MTRFRSLAIAAGLLVVSATVVAAFSALPDAASDGLAKAITASGRTTLPARPGDPPTHPTQGVDVTGADDVPDAAGHGLDVSTVATGEDPTPDTPPGADVSAVAKDNHGREVADEHRPAEAGKPEEAGQPEDAGAPAGAGKPDGAGQPEDPGQPDGAGKPEGVPPGP